MAQSKKCSKKLNNKDTNLPFIDVLVVNTFEKTKPNIYKHKSRNNININYSTHQKKT